MRPIITISIVALVATANLAYLSTVEPALSFDVFRPGNWFAPDRCLPEVPLITLTTATPRVEVDLSQTQVEVDARARTLSMAVRNGWVTNGLATANLLSSGEMVTREYRLSDNLWCVSLSTADIDIRYEDPMKVLISREYPEGSCPYQAIYNHEMQHVTIYAEVLERHLAGAERRLAEKIRLIGGSLAPTIEEAKDRMDSFVNSVIDEMTSEITNEARTLNAALDTPGNYMVVQSQCNDW